LTKNLKMIPNFGRGFRHLGKSFNEKNELPTHNIIGDTTDPEFGKMVSFYRKQVLIPSVTSTII
jgi:hypothetical protein